MFILSLIMNCLFFYRFCKVKIICCKYGELEQKKMTFSPKKVIFSNYNPMNIFNLLLSGLAQRQDCKYSISNYRGGFKNCYWLVLKPTNNELYHPMNI